MTQFTKEIAKKYLISLKKIWLKPYAIIYDAYILHIINYNIYSIR